MPYIEVNDLNVHYYDRGEGAPLIAAHAATVTGLEMDWVARPIERMGFRVVRPDLRAHGETENPAPDQHTTRMVEDMVGFMDALELNPVHALGYSMGGGVTLNTARLYPERYKSIVVMGTNYHAPSKERQLAVLGPPEDRHPVVRRVFSYETGFPPGWAERKPEDYSTITCPVLIIIGDRDDFVDIEEDLALYRALPDARLCVIPNCDHLGLVRHPIALESLSQFYYEITTP